ncbi:MAG: ATP-dependent DNA helicase RecG [Planctomycetota bacterium]|nr:ATP-dependent DNA helicase RecG [Planctomycetota bacterium]
MAASNSSEPTAAHRPRIGPLTELDGIGPARAAAFAAIGVADIGDLMFLAPTRLVRGSDVTTIADALRRIGTEVTLAGRIEKASLQRFGKRSTVRVVVTDDTGTVTALFFNQAWLLKRMRVGETLQLRGKIGDAADPKLSSPKIGASASPLHGANEIAVEYRAPEGVSSAFVAKLVRSIARQYGDRIVDPVDPQLLAKHGLPSLTAAVRDMHEPSSDAVLSAARRRLTLETLLELSARLRARRDVVARGRALTVAIDDTADRAVRARFPFRLTSAQTRVADELRCDLARTQPMRRLLQGDVGSGKTAMGTYAAMLVARSRGQTAFMAPTELLAEQHWIGLARTLEQAGLRSCLLTGSLKTAERRAALARIADGSVDVVFGTHALFSADVEYARLALCVIDEQHRFGVAQRAELLEKGRDVHALLMTATPIPRTQALATYGDLDTSVLDERPPNRGAITTQWVRGDKKRVERELVTRVAAGERVYWVVPRIGEAEDVHAEVDAKSMSAEVRFDRLTRSPLAEHGIELVHGRLQTDVRSARLERFRSGAVRTLVATTVIEVGVDVPEASVKVIETAERLGLAQLHQLRGRVGRGPTPSSCYLFGALSGERRFTTLVRTNDGFEIAEEDMRQRGMGDLMGLRQAGVNTEGLADIDLDLDLLLLARRVVGEDRAAFECYAALARTRPQVHSP